MALVWHQEGNTGNWLFPGIYLKRRLVLEPKDVFDGPLFHDQDTARITARMEPERFDYEAQFAQAAGNLEVDVELARVPTENILPGLIRGDEGNERPVK